MLNRAPSGIAVRPLAFWDLCSNVKRRCKVYKTREVCSATLLKKLRIRLSPLYPLFQTGGRNLASNLIGKDFRVMMALRQRMLPPHTQR